MPTYAQENDGGKDKSISANLNTLQEKCSNSDFQSCLALGNYYAYESDYSLDFIKAKNFYEKACNFGRIQEACDRLVFKRGATSRIKSYRVPRDVSRAAKIFNYYKKETDYEVLYEIFKEYCEEEKDLRACAYCGEMKIQGLGTKQTINRGMKLLYDSASEAEVYASANLGYRYFAADEVDTDEFKAFNLLNYACNNGEFGSCRYVAAFYENDIGVSYSPDKVEYLYSKACDNADAISCHKLGTLYLKSDDQEKRKAAPKILDTGCRYGSIRACGTLGNLYKKGEEGLEVNKDKAFDLFRQACNGGDSNSCYQLAQCYQNGEGVKKSRNVAATLYVKACETGSSKACEHIKNQRTRNEKDQERISKQASATE